jgi:hypothetical protein
VWRKDLDAGLKKKISDWLFAYGNAGEEKARLAALQWGQFKKSDNNQLLPIRQMELNDHEVKGDEKTAAADRRRSSPSSRSSSPRSVARSTRARSSRQHTRDLDPLSGNQARFPDSGRPETRL